MPGQLYRRQLQLLHTLGTDTSNFEELKEQRSAWKGPRDCEVTSSCRPQSCNPQPEGALSSPGNQGTAARRCLRAHAEALPGAAMAKVPKSDEATSLGSHVEGSFRTLEWK